MVFLELHTLDNDQFGMCPRYRNSPLSISQVCRDWRSLAISLPRLWSYVSIVIDEKMDVSVFLLKLWLERSQSVQLSLRIKESKFCISSEYINQVFALYLPHIERWHSMVLILRHVPSDFIKRVASLHAPCLENFSLCLKYVSDNGAFSTLLQSAPRLRRLWHTVSRSTLDIPTRWAQLLQISLRYVDSSDCLEILQHAEQLEECRLILTHSPLASAHD
jgi:hypothetical protein